MCGPRALAVLFASTLSLPAASWAAEPGRLELFGRRYSVVAGAKAFRANRAATRQVYGGVRLAPDLRLWHFDSKKGPALAFELGFTRLKKEEASADFISTGLGVRLVLASPDRALVPYWILRAGPYFPKISSRGRRVAAGANSELGVSVADRVVLAARYDLMGNVHGVRLSGYTARVGVRVY